MCVNTKNQKQKSKTSIPKAFISAKRNKTINKMEAFINALIHKTKKEKRKRKQHPTPKTTTTHKTKAFINAHTHKLKQQNHQQSTSKTSNKKQPKSTIQTKHQTNTTKQN